MVKNKTILFISDVFGGLGGAERNLFHVATSLNKSGYRAVICALQGGIFLENLIKHKNKYFNELEIKNLQIINFNLKKVYSFFSILKIIKLLFMIKKENVKLIVSYHETSDFIGAMLSFLGRVPAISSRRDMGFKLKKRHVKIYKLINPLFDKIITVSNAVKNVIIEREGAHPFKITTVHNGTDVNYFSQHVNISEVKNRLKLPNDQPIVGILAGISKIKGHKILIEAIPTVLKQSPDVQFIIVGGNRGNDEENFKQDLINFARDLGVSNNVYFSERTTKVNEILKIMNIFVLTSLSEGFSNTIIEAMAAEKPVIAANVGGNPEAVVNGKTGLLIPPSDPKALAEAILTLLKDKELAIRMGKEGKKRVDVFFNIDAMIENTKKVYEAAIQSRIHEKRYLKLTTLSKSLKLIIDNILCKLGLVHLYFFFSNKIMSDRGIKILCYHKVDNNEDPLNMSVSTRNFERQLSTLKKFYKIIPLSEAIDIFNGNGSIPYNAVVITFDDGYKSIYTNAYPIIKKYGVPITIFLTANVIDNKKKIWYDTLCTFIDETDSREVFFNDQKIYIGDQYTKNIFKKDLVTTLKNMNEDGKNELIGELMSQLDSGENRGKNRNNNLYLTKKEIIEMGQNGVAFGSHTLSHPILTQTSIELARNEIIDSKSVLEKVLKIKVDYFAYPNGNYNKELKNIIKEAGYISALTLDCGSNKKNNIDMFSMKRINISEGMHTNLFGKFSVSLFICEVIGINRKLLSPFKFLKKTGHHN